MKNIVFLFFTLFSINVFAELPVIQFDEEAKYYKEGQRAIISASLSAPTTLGVNVKLVIEDISTADIGDHGVEKYADLYISPGQTKGFISLNLVDDGLSEGFEFVDFRMSAPQNAKLGTKNKIRVTIEDNFTVMLPEVNFSTAVSTGSEGQTLDVVATLSEPSASLITVPVIVEGTATPLDDHDLPPEIELIFYPGETQVTLSITILNDYIHTEIEETIEMRMIGPVSNAKLGSDRNHLVTISADPSEPK